MAHRSLLALSLLFLPLFAFASTVQSARTLVLSEAPTDNTYLSGTEITVVVPLPADLLAAGGTIAVQAPIGGDAMLAGGSVTMEQPVAGDARIVGGQIKALAPVQGDFFALGGSVTASTSAKDTRIVAGTVTLTGGSRGPVMIYGSDISLDGDFAGNVTIVASDRITIGDHTHIHGVLNYNAPQQIVLPSSTVVDGGTTYIGTSPFLPTTKEAHTFAIAGATILFIVHLLAVLILAGLIAGLFPYFTEQVGERTLGPLSRRFVLLGFLGFGILVAAPVLILFLLVSVVGIGIALMLIALYALLLMLAYVYAGILAGGALARTFFKRYIITWKEAVLGMLVLYLVGIIPVLGSLVKIILMMVAAGAIVSITYAFVFKRTQDELPLEEV